MGPLKVASLFCGCGGLDLGLIGGFKYLDKQYAKHPAEIVYAVDFDPYPCSIYNENFEHKCHTEDITKVNSSDIPPHHILIGGFPCQSFSVVAQNPPRLGYKDIKGQLFFEMVRILKERKPAMFIAENVKGILSANQGQAFPLILESFRNAGYHVTYALLNSSDFGIPQKRERVFIVGIRDKKTFENFKFPTPLTPKEKIPLSRVVLNEHDVCEKYYFSDKAIEGMLKAKDKMNKGRAQKLDAPCNTISAHLSKASLNSVDPVLYINNKYRRFTPLEAARIQSFPDNFIFSGSDTRNYRAIGNAVPPVLIWHVSDALFKAVKSFNNQIFQTEPCKSDPEKRSYNMSQIKSKNTKIELKLRKALWNKGYRYRVCPKDLFGKPDIAFPSHKLAIFCDSAFWHGKKLDETVEKIKTNHEYWSDKIMKNKVRDDKVNDYLTKSGWTVLRFWDDEINYNLENCIKNIEDHIKLPLKKSA